MDRNDHHRRLTRYEKLMAWFAGVSANTGILALVAWGVEHWMR